MTLRAVTELVDNLPGIEVGAKWGRKTWMVRGNSVLWERPLGKTDVERLGDRTVPEGDIVAIAVENLDAKDALLAMELPGFFTIEHFNGFPGVLIELRLARAKDVRAAIQLAHSAASARKPRVPAKKPARKPRRKR
jgi:hypothetical protein